MTLNELQEQALKLPLEERLQLIDALTRFSRGEAVPTLQPQCRTTTNPKGLVASLVGIAKTDEPVPTDEEVKALLDERLVQKY